MKAEIDKLLEAGYIFKVNNSEWIGPMVVVPKKNGKLCICVDYRALNKATKKDPFPIPSQKTF